MIDIVQNELPHKVPPQKGYEALIGMLNWVMVYDVENALSILLETFYSKVCKECLPKVQTTQYIDFRTRYTSLLAAEFENEDFSEHFPFDEVLLRPLSKDDRNTPSTKHEGADHAISKAGLLKNVVIDLEKQKMCDKFKATFDQETEVKFVQIYFND
jgi:hypothetical protein